jgi:hypothetical protein
MAEPIWTLTRHDLETKIIKRCWEDEAFCAEFTADPAEAFVKYLEIPAANIPKIFVHHESAGSWHIVLPAQPTNVDELSERDLESVAGASAITTTWFVSGAVALSLGPGVTAAASYITHDQGW